MIAFVAILVALSACLASARRLWLVTHPTAIHPDDVLAVIGPGADRLALSRLRASLEREPAADWERDLLDALSAGPEARVALVNEQLTELDHRVQRWMRVPRVAASVATSVGILLGTMVLRNGLASAPEEITESFVWMILEQAILVVTLGIAGTTFAIAAHAQARKLARERLAAADRMVERLEAIAAAASDSADDTRMRRR